MTGALFHAPAVPYRLVIFDFDGVLADTLPWFEQVMDGVADRYRFRRPSEFDRAALRAAGPRALLDMLGVARWKLPLIARHMRRLKARDAGRVRLFPGAAETLAELARNGVATAIVSSDAEANIRRALGPDLAALVDHFACSASLFGKPAKIRRVLAHAGCPAEMALYLGDEARDGEAARRAGIAFAGACWGFATAQSLARQGPVALLPDIRAVRDLALGATSAVSSAA